jgi:RNA polymerase sporulation-specific sigma factor
MVATTSIGHLPDDELVQRAQEGDDAAINALIERYRRFARAKSRGYFIVGGDADDLEQEALIGLYKAVRDFRTDRAQSFRAFVELCVTRQIITAIKTASRRKHEPLNRAVPISGRHPAGNPSEVTLEEVPVEDSAPGPADVVVSVETMARMEATLTDVLSDFELQVLGLHVAGRSYVEMGEALGRDSKAIDNALQRIKRKLEGRLGEASSANFA